MSTRKIPFILTIDDDEDFNRLISHTLKKINVNVETTTNPKNFLTRLKETDPCICIIDLNLDKLYGAGFQIIQAIRNIRGDKIPLIVMSKRKSRTDITTALALGASDYLSKPLDESLFLTKIKQFIEIRHKKPFTTGLTSKFLLPFKIVPNHLKELDINFQLILRDISEFGITLEGSHFINRGTSIKIQNNILSEATGVNSPMRMKVHDNWLDTKSQKYCSFLEFDSDNHELMENVRNWLHSKR